ncbi:hypothetical protein ILYODFUR_004247 [Ilyodon furcidens]|uniref:Uncharacterized protein n=2 Tax=Goodeidae TaxID=28758 RepID=A0ABV0TS77_9TELE
MNKQHYEDQETYQTGQGKSCGKVYVRDMINNNFLYALNISHSTVQFINRKCKQYSCKPTKPGFSLVVHYKSFARGKSLSKESHRNFCFHKYLEVQQTCGRS